jgi:hypothetical protein
MAEPLFHDPYAACLAAINFEEEEEEDAPSVQANGESPGLYELATRFIDDTLLGIVKDNAREVRQVGYSLFTRSLNSFLQRNCK